MNSNLENVLLDPLAELNQRVAGIDDQLFPNPDQSNNVFVVGAPRSGTTIVSQILSAAFDVGYINNLAASFWKAPAFGVTYANRFVSERRFVGQSTYGATTELSEPHEFGGYWRNMLGYSDMFQKENHTIDLDQLLRSLDQIGAAWGGRSVFYKVFQLAWHIQEFHERRPNTKWIYVHRDMHTNVQSLMALREKRNEHWVSAVPLLARQFDSDPAWLRVSAQVLFMNKWLESEFNGMNPDVLLDISLEELCSDPVSPMARIESFLDIEIATDSIDTICTSLRQSVKHESDCSSKIRDFLENNGVIS